ncbi:MAG: hypothetical protein Q4A00_05155 [Flavobacteriaceae bacterium]|nr:hypothetical protein [Flavobacteriaceae bacterium]
MKPEDFITEEIQQERELNKEEGFNLGEYIYMGMGLVGEHKVCIAVAYKIGYCVKKSVQFITAAPNVKFTHISKVKVGELEACQKFEIK